MKRYLAGVALWSHHFNSAGVQTSVDKQYLYKDAFGSITLISDGVGAGAYKWMPIRMLIKNPTDKGFSEAGFGELFNGVELRVDFDPVVSNDRYLKARFNLPVEGFNGVELKRVSKPAPITIN